MNWAQVLLYYKSVVATIKKASCKGLLDCRDVFAASQNRSQVMLWKLPIWKLQKILQKNKVHNKFVSIRNFPQGEWVKNSQKIGSPWWVKIIFGGTYFVDHSKAKYPHRPIRMRKEGLCSKTGPLNRISYHNGSC